MKAIKENREYTITEAEAESFRKEGYDIIDDMGNIVAYGAGKTVSYDKYSKLCEDFEKLMEENAELKSQLSKLSKQKKTTAKAKAEE